MPISPAWNRETLVLLGVMVITLGLVALLTHGVRPVARFTLSALASLAVGCGIGVFLLPTANLSGTIFVLAGAAAATQLPWRAAGRRLVRQLRCPQRRWAAVVVGAICFTVAATCLQEDAEEIYDPASVDVRSIREHLRKVDQAAPLTDAGREIPLWTLPEGKVPDLAAMEAPILRDFMVIPRAIRTAPADGQCNCHGWVFTGGRFWISPEGVELILADNGYGPIEVPGAGDLVVYRDRAGQISHTGLVRGSSADGRVLVESKWGALGRFVHVAEEQPFPGSASYLRTIRGGHAIRGLDLSPSPARVLGGG
jgi:hypothetical protein